MTPTGQGQQWHSTVDTLRATGQAPVMRVSTRGPLVLRGLAQSSAGAAWRRALVTDIQLLHIIMKDKLEELPDPSLQQGRWEAFWRR